LVFFYYLSIHRYLHLPKIGNSEAWTGPIPVGDPASGSGVLVTGPMNVASCADVASITGNVRRPFSADDADPLQGCKVRCSHARVSCHSVVSSFVVANLVLQRTHPL
jgi:hypothetical protein